jgi:hypothetical protein
MTYRLLPSSIAGREVLKMVFAVCVIFMKWRIVNLKVKSIRKIGIR